MRALGKGNRRILIGVILLWWSLAVSLQADSTPKKWAIIVGINDYKRDSVTNLKFADQDARLFAAALEELAEVTPDRIFLYTSDSVNPSEQPRLTNLVFRLEWLKDHVSPEDSVTFYFAGHGVEAEGETFLLTDNADNRSRATLAMSSLKASLLFDLLQDCGAKETLVILDACRNDPQAGRGSQDNALTETMSRGLVFRKIDPEKREQRHLATLFACGVGERSYEWPEKGHGYFTYNLVRGLRDGVGDATGRVTLAGLASYVRSEVAELTGRSGVSQEPALRYEGPSPERWVLAQREGRVQPDGTEDAPTLENLLLENEQLREENARLRSELEKRRP